MFSRKTQDWKLLFNVFQIAKEYQFSAVADACLNAFVYSLEDLTMWEHASGANPSHTDGYSGTYSIILGRELFPIPFV